MRGIQALPHKGTRCIRVRWKCKTSHTLSLKRTRLFHKTSRKSNTREKAELHLKREYTLKSKFAAKWLLNKWSNSQLDINSETAPRRKASSHKKSSIRDNIHPIRTPAGRTIKITKADKNTKRVKMAMRCSSLPKCRARTKEYPKTLLLNMWTCDHKEAQATTNIIRNRMFVRIHSKTRFNQIRILLKELDRTLVQTKGRWWVPLLHSNNKWKWQISMDRLLKDRNPIT